MKIIDLLNKIANGEEVPKKIKYDDNIYLVNRIALEKGKADIDYYCNDNCEMLFADVIPIHRCLNEEVEIIEEPFTEEIKELPIKYEWDFENRKQKISQIPDETTVVLKVNEIIRKLKEMENEK